MNVTWRKCHAQTRREQSFECPCVPRRIVLLSLGVRLPAKEKEMRGVLRNDYCELTNFTTYLCTFIGQNRAKSLAAANTVCALGRNACSSVGA